MNPYDIIANIQCPVWTELRNKIAYLLNGGIVVLPGKAARIVDENNVILRGTPQDIAQFLSDWRLSVCLGRPLARVMSIEPEQTWLRDVRQNTREYIAAVALHH